MSKNNNMELIYKSFVETKNYTQEMQECIVSTVDKLLNNLTDDLFLD